MRSARHDVKIRLNVRQHFIECSLYLILITANIQEWIFEGLNLALCMFSRQIDFCTMDITRVIGYPARKGIVNDRISVVFNRIPSVKFSIQR